MSPPFHRQPYLPPRIPAFSTGHLICFSNTTQSDSTAIGIDGGSGQNQIGDRTLGVTADATSSGSAPVINVQCSRYLGTAENDNPFRINRGLWRRFHQQFRNDTVTATSVANTGHARAGVFGSAINGECLPGTGKHKGYNGKHKHRYHSFPKLSFLCDQRRCRGKCRS